MALLIPESLSPHREVSTTRGPVHIYSHCTAEELAGLDVDPGIGVFRGYRSILRTKQDFARIAAWEDGNLILAVSPERRIVGYTACGYPGPQESFGPWNQDRLFYELGSIEVSRQWRGQRLARSMVAVFCADPWIEEKIAYLTGFCWHWDLEWGQGTYFQYRRRLANLFSAFGFKVYLTNEPNVAMNPENFLMARIGSRVSAENRKRFQRLLYSFNLWFS